MKKFSFRKKGLIKSTINNQQSSIGLGTKLRSLLLLVVAIMTCGEAWGADYYASCVVKAEPLDVGGVWVTSSATGTPDYYASTDVSNTNHWTGWGKSFTFYSYHTDAEGYTFKGWSTSNNVNSGESESKSGKWYYYSCKFDASSTSSGSPTTKTYYAIYAGIIHSGSQDCGSSNVGTKTSGTEIEFTHAHAGKITAAISGTNASDFTLNTSTPVASSVSKSTGSVTVYFTPSCSGSRTATLTLSGDNGVSKEITLTGTGNALNPSFSTNDNGSVNVTTNTGSPTYYNLDNSVTTNCDGARTYTCSAGNQVISGNQFYATAAGTYTINVSIATGCTYAGKSGSFKVTVNRLNPTLSMSASSVDVTTVTSSPTILDLASKTTYSGNGTLTYELLSATSVSGKDCKSSGVLNGSNFYATTAGTYNFSVSAPTTAQYNSKSTDFSVTVNRVDGQTISWSTSATTFVEGDVITASGAIGSTVTLERSGDGAKYISVSGNEATITEVLEEGSYTAKLTANASATDVYKATSAEKNITITSLKKQTITWTQTFDQLLKGGSQITLNATATAGACYYTSSNNSVVSVSGNTLTIVGEGTAILTAKHDGNATYAPVSMTKSVLVSDPTKACPTNIKLYEGEFSIGTKSSYGTGVSKDFEVKTPGSISFTAEVHSGNYGNDIWVLQYVNGAWQDSPLYKEYLGSSTPVNITNVDINATQIRIQTQGIWGYKVSNVSYTRVTHCNPSVSALNFTTSPSTAAAAQTFTIDYSNVKAFLSVSSGSHYSISHSVIGDCGLTGKETITVNYTAPATTGSDNDVLYFKDVTGKTVAQVNLNATVTKLSQTITNHTIGTTYKTTDKITLSATASSGLTEFEYTATPSGVASFGGDAKNVMTFSNSCDNLSITVKQPGTNVFEPCSTTVSNIKVSKVTPTITTIPTAAAITYGAKLKTSALSNGVAKVKLRGTDTEVAGTWSWDEGEEVKTANGGTALSYPVTFTPDDGGMYNAAKCSVSVQINQATQTITWTQNIPNQTYLESLDLTATTVAGGGAITYSCSPDLATVAGAKLTFNKGIGNITVTATAAANANYKENTATKSFEIVRRNPVITKSDFAASYLVDDTRLDLQTIWTNDGDGEVTYSIVTFTPSGKNNDDATAPAITENRYLSLGQAGTLKIQMSIAQGNNYNAKTVEHTLYINKYSNFLKVNDNAAYTTSIGYGAGEGLTLTTNNPVSATTPIVIKQTAGEESATYYNGTEPAGSGEGTQITDLSKQQAIYASHIGGTATWTLNQAENYKYASASATIQATVEAQSTTCYVLNDETERTLTLIETGPALEVTGPANQLYFDAKYPDAETVLHGQYFWVQYSTDGSNYIDIDDPSLEKGYKTFGPYNIPESAKYIRFETRTGSTYAKQYKNVRVTRKTYLTPATNDVYAPQIQAGKSSSTTFNFAWSTCASEINIVSSNPKFTVSPTTIASTTAGNQTITITYSSNEEEVDAQSTITFYTPYEETTVTAHGTTVGKLATTINYIGAASYDVNVGNLSASQLFEVRDANNQLVSSANITLATGDGSIISLVDANTINPVCGGTATITASYAGDETTYQPAADKPQSITINKINDEVNFVAGKSVILNGDSYEANWATAVSGSTITYSSDNESIIKVEDGFIKAVGKGTANIIATSAGNCQYISNNASFPVKVRNAEDPCETKLKEDYSKYSVSQTYGYEAKEIEIAEGPSQTLTFKVWRAITAGEEATLTLKDISGNPLGSYVYKASDLSTSKPDVPNAQIDMTKHAGARIIRMEATGYVNKYFSDLVVTQQVYLTPSSSAVTMSLVKACDTASAEFTLSYSDISRIQMSHKNNDFWYEIWKGDSKIEDFDNDCGDWGTYTLKCFYAPQQVGDYKDTITVSASGISKTIIVSGTALKPDRTIVWDLAPGNEIFVTQSVTLDARAKTKCLDPAGEVEYSADPADAATIDGNKVTFTKAGTVTVYANTVASDLYGDAQSVYKVWSVKKVIAVVTKAPEITSTITYLDKGSDVQWTKDWQTVDSLNKQPLPGTMTYALPTEFTSAGEQYVTFNFTPTDLGNYDPTTAKVLVNVQKGAPTITWPTVSNPTYSPDLTLNNVSLIGGSASYKGYVVNGSFAWKAPSTALVAGESQTFEVIFTPDDSNNLKSDTSSITFSVLKATPEATPSAADITFGQKVSESVLSNTGIAGTWTWNAAIADLTKDAGTYSDLPVHFKPTDTDNYTEKDGTVTLTVNQAPPVVIVTASDITYGQKLSESQFSNSSMEGAWTWIDEHKEDVKDVGSYDVLAHFVPTNGNYKAIDQNVSVTVNQATPSVTTWPTASQITEGQALSQSSLSGGVASVDGSFAWKEPTTVPAVGETAYLVVFTPTDGDNYTTVEGDVTVKVVPASNTFINTKGDGNWNDAANWSSGVVPAKDQEVDINVKGELNIAETITVGSLTIENTGKVNVIQSGKLSVKKESGESASGYGDLYVKNGGDIALDAKLDIRNFYIESSIGSGQGDSKSGQITKADNLAFHEGDAYIDINLDPSGKVDDSKWYAFAVPFEVDIATGISRKENDGSFKQLKDKTNFDIEKYNPDKRRDTGKGWEYYHGVLQPGEFYLFAIDGTNNVYRFQKKNGSSISAGDQKTVSVNGDVSNPNANWNPVGNPCLRHTTNDFKGFLQVYKNGKNAYLTVDTDEKVTYVVGCPFFVQAKENGIITYTPSDETTGTFYSPRRSVSDAIKYKVQLLQQNGNLEDQIFILASENASSSYEVGSDLQKAGTSTYCGQMWINAYSQKLSVNEALLENNSATYSLSLYAPKAGEYTLHVGNNTANGILYLTKNGNIIWDLSKDDYPVSLTAGTNSEYGLVFQKTIPNIPTGIDNTKAASEQIEKFIYQEQMYILKNGRLYNSAGAEVK